MKKIIIFYIVYEKIFALFGCLVFFYSGFVVEDGTMSTPMATMVSSVMMWIFLRKAYVYECDQGLIANNFAFKRRIEFYKVKEVVVENVYPGNSTIAKVKSINIFYRNPIKNIRTYGSLEGKVLAALKKNGVKITYADA